MNIYQFMSDSPILAFFIVLFAVYILELLIFKLPNRYFRSKNITANGWPPSHCDADGDFKKDDE